MAMMKAASKKCARLRIEEANPQQLHSLDAVHKGTPMQAEPDKDRLARRLEAKARLVAREGGTRASVPNVLRGRGGPERVWGATIDFVGVAFLERGVNAARTVGRVAFRDGRAQGSGFLIAPGLFLTNNHVLESAGACADFVVEFDYELDAFGRRREVSRFELNPNAFFIADDRDDLDYSLVAIGRRLDGPIAIESLGFSSISGANNKHALGEVANIVQHPDGRLKEVVLRENRLVSRLSHVLHYVADTEPGSSGSPVFNNEWQAIALHHWGEPFRQNQTPDGKTVPKYVNEGIRISAIVGELAAAAAELPAAKRRRLEEALSLGEATEGVPVSPPPPAVKFEGVETRPDGTAVWRVPIEISVRIPTLSLAQTDHLVTSTAVSPPQVELQEAFRRNLDDDYRNRKGYDEKFIPGFRVPLPSVSTTGKRKLAKNIQSGGGKVELPYEHFSVYVDKTRGLPMMTAVNIDGKNLKDIDRTTGDVSDAESLTLGNEGGPEAREKWYDDPRIDPKDCGNDALYTDQVVSDGRNRTGRIFHRGHMVRRLDPCWGSKKSALRAEADTFHFTNCTPQVGMFNSGQTLWQGIENHVLDNARVQDLRACVFTGPILKADDPKFRNDVFPGFRVPRKFWKIVVWNDGASLSALAMVADQSGVLREMPERAEDMDDTTAVEDFVSTVAWVERNTGLDFGAAVRNADLYEDDSESMGIKTGLKRIARLTDLRLERSKRTAPKYRSVQTARSFVAKNRR